MTIIEVPSTRPKKYFYQKPSPLPRPKKLARSLSNICIEYMDKFEEKEMIKKKLFTKNTWYDWLIHYIPESIKNSGLFKIKTMGLFKTNTTEAGKERRKPKLHKKKQKNN